MQESRRAQVSGPEWTEQGLPAPDCRVAGLAKSYRCGLRGRSRAALAGVSFEVPRGRIVGLLGHNGAGKTTAIKAILDLVRPDAGRIELFGRDHRELAARAQVGYLPENPYFYDYLSGQELLDFHGRLCGLYPRDRRRRAAQVLAQVGLAEQARLPLRKYSKGMLQRIGLAQALLGDPALLILDEPMSGLDPLGRREVRDLLGELRARGKTVLLSSHIVPDLEALADSVVILAHGRVAAVHDLQLAAAARFEVWAARAPAALAGGAPADGRDPTWTGCPVRPAGGGRAGVVMTVPDLPRLRLLLARCADEEITVRGVDSHQGGLEELFLRSLGAEPADGVPGRAAARRAAGVPAAWAQPERGQARAVPEAAAGPQAGAPAAADELIGAGAGAGEASGHDRQ